MVKLGFVKYESTNNGTTITNVKLFESTPIKSKPSFSFINSGTTIRDYLKRKIFKATKEEVSSLLKSTSNLNLASKFSSKSTKNNKVPKSRECVKVKSSEGQDERITVESNNQCKTNFGYQHEQNIEKNGETEVTLMTEGPAILNIESSNEIEEPVVEIKSTPSRRFSLIRISKRKKKKTRFAEDSTQSLPVASCSSSVASPPSLDNKRQPKIVKWTKKMRKSKAKTYISSGDIVLSGRSDDSNEEEMKIPVKWTKRVRKFAIRTCRYLGYGAQMVSPMTPYTDIPMPVTYDGLYNVYPPYYGSEPYYSYSSCGSIYGYKMSHYGLTY